MPLYLFNLVLFGIFLSLQSGFFPNFSHRKRTIDSNFSDPQDTKISIERHMLSRYTRCAFSFLLVHGHGFRLNIYIISSLLELLNILAKTPVTNQLRNVSSHSLLACHDFFMPNIFGKRFLTLQLLV